MDRETRALQGVELRTDDADRPIIDGYASVTGVWYDVAGGPGRGGWREMIVPGAFDKTLAEQLDAMYMLVDHDGFPLAGTRNGTLVLEEDKHGLRSEAHIDMSMGVARDAVAAVRSGLIDSMSFAFMAMRQEWNDEYTERLITEARVLEVSLVKWPANPATVAQMRSKVDEWRSARTVAPAGMSLDMARALALTEARRRS